ncbi:ribonuclease P protein component [Marinobacteraceae bacterium S3BR75-40.1]
MSDLTFPRHQRLLTAGDYRRVFNAVQFRVPSRHFLILATPNDTEHARIGLIFAKKNLKRAVDRNRIKRLTRESFRHHKQQLPAVDIVVLGRRGLAELDNASVYRILDKLWHRLGKAAKQTGTEPNQ